MLGRYLPLRWERAPHFHLTFVAILAVAMSWLSEVSGPAHPWSPPTLSYVAQSDTIYLVKVISTMPGPDSVHPSRLTVKVAEILRGTPMDILNLVAYEDPEFVQNTQWIIFHNPTGFKGCVGWAMKGDCEWLPIEVTGQGDKKMAKWIGSLTSVRDYLKRNPAKTVGQ